MQDEIAKHTKKIYKTLTSPKHIFSEKVKEVIIEICIIVFAITVSIWLHSWSEHRHQQAEVKEFLEGLKSDIEKDIEHYKRDSISFNDSRKKLEFNINLTKVRLDSLDKSKSDSKIDYMLPSIWCNFNDGRYEGFKSSGKIELIENKLLKSRILGYFQSNIPEIHRAEEEFKNNRNQVTDMMLIQSGNENVRNLMITPKMKAIYQMSIENLDWIIRNQQYALGNARAIKAEIEATLEK